MLNYSTDTFRRNRLPSHSSYFKDSSETIAKCLQQNKTEPPVITFLRGHSGQKQRNSSPDINLQGMEFSSDEIGGSNLPTALFRKALLSRSLVAHFPRFTAPFMGSVTEKANDSALPLSFLIEKRRFLVLYASQRSRETKKKK
ncbi:hypothetical protein AVEN_190615-1 [Araneus ventricosus]|uniref:Uncharacterized protein n=1 Tax=Araneus ventricosus TaxID=182803 RepID=A0A4Y2CCP0_ARAVE|nr:hypothetical protein AVEN_190615-1 [Araneus ventricosus]